MRRVISSTYISLDGVLARPADFSVDYLGGDALEAATEQLFGSDVLLMGRRTYEMYAAVYPGRGGDPITDRMNAITKVVVSSTLGEPAWANTTVLRGDPVAAVRGLRSGPGGDVLVYGFGQVARALLAHGLLDELRLWVHPVLHGRGDPADLLFRGGQSARFDHLHSRTLRSGVLITSYAPRPPRDLPRRRTP